MVLVIQRLNFGVRMNYIETFMRRLSILLIVSFFWGVTYFFIFRNNSNWDNTQAMISTIIQAQITCIAIILSVTLVIIQMMASTYTLRGINLLKTDTTIKEIIGLLGLLILFGLLLLRSLPTDPAVDYILITPFELRLNVESLIAFEIFWGVLTVFLMYLFVIRIVDLFQPEIMIKFLAREIDIKKVSAISNPYQSYFDVLFRAIKNQDTTTLEIGMSEAFTCFDDRMRHAEFRDVQNNSIKFHLELRKLTQRLFDEDFRDSNIILLHRISDSADAALIDRDDVIIPTDSINSTYIIGKKAVECQDDLIVPLCIETLGRIGRKSIQSSTDERYQQIAASCLKKIIQLRNNIHENDMELDGDVGKNIEKYIKYIGLYAYRNHLWVAEDAARSLAEYYRSLPSRNWRSGLYSTGFPIPFEDSAVIVDFIRSVIIAYDEFPENPS